MLFPRGKTKFVRPSGLIGKQPGHAIVLLGMGLPLIAPCSNLGSDSSSNYVSSRGRPARVRGETMPIKIKRLTKEEAEKIVEAKRANVRRARERERLIKRLENEVGQMMQGHPRLSSAGTSFACSGRSRHRTAPMAARLTKAMAPAP
jgi:hypothetical protein